VTPETRAARDRIAAVLDYWDKDPLSELFGSGHAAVRFKGDLHLVLAALDRYEAIEESVLETARQVAEHATRFGPVPERVEVSYIAAGPHGQCEGCGCCNASGCHRGPDSLCPTNSLGESVCPCTED
jgi:hypothetical protein